MRAWIVGLSILALGSGAGYALGGAEEPRSVPPVATSTQSYEDALRCVVLHGQFAEAKRRGDRRAGFAINDRLWDEGCYG